MTQSTTTTVIYDAQGNVIGGSHIRLGRGKPISLTDSTSGNIFTLDSAHIIISAHDSNGKLLWKSDPWKDYKIEIYRTDRPVIVDCGFGQTNKYFPDEIPDGAIVLWIKYINTQFGFLDLKTGKFYFCGQD